MVMNSKICTLFATGIGEYFSEINVDLSIVCIDGKYGIVHNTRVESRTNSAEYDKTLILECVYDNLYFIELNEMPYLVAVQSGKQGLLMIKAHLNNDLELCTVSKLQACVYDRIEAAGNNTAFLLHKHNTIFCYDPIENEIFVECESVEELGEYCLWCKKGDTFELWNTFYRTKIIELHENVSCSLLGAYRNGNAFMLQYQDKCSDNVMRQLLFYDNYCRRTRLSPKAKKIKVYTTVCSGESLITGVEMFWGDWETPLSNENVDEIAK